MICIYKQDNNNYTNNGDAVLIPTVCDLAMTINGAWQLKIEHPYDPEERYKLITEGAIIRIELECIAELETVYQLFRVYQYTKGLHSIEAIAFPVAMESTYDAPIDNLVISGKTGAQAMAQLQTFTNKYTLSSDVTATGSSSYNNTNINEAIASGNDNSFIQVWGGEILYDNYKFKVKTRLGDDTAGDHRVMYGRNLTNIEYEKDDSGIITRISPISQDNIRLDGTGYVDSSHISDYPVAHHRYETAPYTLVDTEATSPSQTATLTRQAVAAVSTQADTLSHNAWTTASGAGYQPEYIKSLKTEITEAVQNMALANVVSTSLYNLMKTTIANAMAWLGDLKQPKWEWMGSYQTGWKYGNATSYAKNMYVKIGKTWSYFGSDGNWQEPKDDSQEWDWHDVKNGTGKKYGNFNKYFAHNEYVYITQSGTIKEYWFNEQGWFEEDESGDSEYYWHGSGTGADPYWFGKDSSTYLKSCWRFIDGTYYFFDSYGYVAAKKDNYQWDWVESGDASRAWFGNAINSEYGSDGACLKSQWEKINGTWYYFDANGIVQSEAVSQTNAIAVFTTGMSGLTTTVDNWKGQLYSLLYSLMRSYCTWRYKQKIDLPAITIKVDMADLSKTEEYKDFADLEKIRLGDSVECIDYEHNISTTNRVIGITYDCILKSNKDITIGEAAATVAQMVGNAQGEAVTGGFDTSALETQLTALRNGKQDKLTAGDNITIENNVISASGSGQGLEYWKETNEDFSREETSELPDRFTAKSEYIFTDSEWSVTDRSSGETYRTYKKQTGRAVCGRFTYWDWLFGAYYVQFYGYAYISTIENAVKYSEGGSSTPWGTKTINGVTFYVSSNTSMCQTDAYNLVPDNIPHIGDYESYEDAVDALIALADIKAGNQYLDTGIGIGENIIWGGNRYDDEEDYPFYVDNEGKIHAKSITVDSVTAEKINAEEVISDEHNVLADFVGATGSTDGVHGLVPAPTTNDVGKVLFADGQWRSIGTDIEDIFSIFDTTIISSQYSSGTLTSDSFSFSVNEDNNSWSASATAYNNTALDITDYNSLIIEVDVTEQSNYGAFWVTLSQTKYTWGTSSWVDVYNNVDSAIKITESGQYEIDVSALSGDYYIYIGASTGKATVTRGDCVNNQNGKIIGTVTAFYGASEGSGGASAVSDLTDVDLTNLSNGQILKYNSTTQKWENANESGGSGNLSAQELTYAQWQALTEEQKMAEVEYHIIDYPDGAVFPLTVEDGKLCIIWQREVTS